MKLLQLQNITKQIQKQNILKDISFSVEKGKIFAFLGINGAGKSTTMNIISALKQQSSGHLFFEENAYTKQTKASIGIVFQENVLDEQLTILQNLKYRSALYYANKKLRNKAIQEVITLLELQPLLHKKVAICSGGERRLACIARAIVSNPKLLILDEPTTGLDVHIRKRIWEVLHKLKAEKGMTIFFSSHYMEEAYHADHICIVHKGQVLLQQPLQTFLSHNERILKINDEVYPNPIKNAHTALQIVKSTNNLHSFAYYEPTIDDIFMRVVKQ